MIIGVDVAVLSAGRHEHGLTMHDPLRGVTAIAVPRSRDPLRQRFSLGDELGHTLFDDLNTHQADWSQRGAQRFADAFARHLLTPLEGAREALAGRSTPTISDLSNLTQRFLVSPMVVAIQAAAIGSIDAETKEAWGGMTAASVAARGGWSDQFNALRTGSGTRRAGQQLLARTTRAYVERVVSIETVARLRSIGVDQVRVDFSEAGVSPRGDTLAWVDAADLPECDDDFSDPDAVDATANHKGTSDHRQPLHRWPPPEDLWRAKGL